MAGPPLRGRGCLWDRAGYRSKRRSLGDARGGRIGAGSADDGYVCEACHVYGAGEATSTHLLRSLPFGTGFPEVLDSRLLRVATSLPHGKAAREDQDRALSGSPERAGGVEAPRQCECANALELDPGAPEQEPWRVVHAGNFQG